MEFDELSRQVIGCALPTCMKLAGIKTGLLINFNSKLKNGIKRFVLRRLRALRVLRGEEKESEHHLHLAGILETWVQKVRIVHPCPNERLFV